MAKKKIILIDVIKYHKVEKSMKKILNKIKVYIVNGFFIC